MIKALAGLFLHNWRLKLTSLVIAVFVWFFVSGERSQTIEIPVTLELLAPENTILLSKAAHSFTVKLRGPYDVLDRIPRPIHRTFAVGTPRQMGVQPPLMITASELNLPASVSLVSVPPQVDIILDESATVTLKVTLKTKGYPPSGYAYEVIGITPDSMAVSGPSSIIKADLTLETVPLDLTGLTMSFEKDLKVVPTSSNPFINIEKPGEVRVAVRIVPDDFEREISVTVRAIVPPNSRFYVSEILPPVIKVKVHGPKNKVEAFSENSVFAFVEIDGITAPGQYDEHPTRVVLPTDVELVGSNPRVAIVVKENQGPQ
ncbi:MAG: YbbR-like domain-containing protein [Candidatus Brocadiia bacterium]